LEIGFVVGNPKPLWELYRRINPWLDYGKVYTQFQSCPPPVAPEE